MNRIDALRASVLRALGEYHFFPDNGHPNYIGASIFSASGSSQQRTLELLVISDILSGNRFHSKHSGSNKVASTIR
jgi:hypothetical protein